MKTKTIGELLKTERLNQRVALPDLARQTRIRLEYLEALEDNRFEVLPAAAFVKGYIKTYAQIFGLDPQPLLALLRRDFKESAIGTLVPREFIKPALKQRQVWTPITVAIIAFATIFITLIGYVSVQWYNIQKPPQLSISTPKENDFVPAHVPIKGQTVPDAIVSVNAQPVAIQADGSFQTEVYIPREGIHTITVEAVDRRGKKSVAQFSVHIKL